MLTERQREVLALMAEGHSYRSAAAALGISFKAVRERLAHARETAGAASTTQLVALAIRNGWMRNEQ